MSRKGPDQTGQGNDSIGEHPIVDIEGVKAAAREKWRVERKGVMGGEDEENFASSEALDAVKRRDTAVLLMEVDYPGSKVIPVPYALKGKEFLQYPYVTDALGLDGYENNLPAVFSGIANLNLGRGDYLVISPDKKDLKVVKADLEYGAVSVKNERTFGGNERMWAKVFGKAEKRTMVADGKKLDELLKMVDYEMDDDGNVIVEFKSREAEKKFTLTDIFDTADALLVNGKLAVKVPERAGQFYYVRNGRITAKRAVVLNGTKVKELLSDDEQRVAKNAIKGLSARREA